MNRRRGSTQEGEETIEIHANVFSGEESGEEMKAHLHEAAGWGRYAFIGEEGQMHERENHVVIEARADGVEAGHHLEEHLEFDVMISPDRTADILAHHPEVDVDGDGEASPEEVRNYFPVWSRDGRRIAFTSDRSGRHQVERLHLDAGEGEESNYSWTTDDGRMVEIKEHGDSRAEGHLMRIHKKHHAGDAAGAGDLTEEELLQYREAPPTL